MFPNLHPSLYNVHPIKLTYLNENRGFYGDFTTDINEGVFQFQDELSAVEDIAIAFDSVNFLTDVRSNMSIGLSASKLAVFNKDIGIDCDNVKESCCNHWITLPLDSYTNISGVCVASTNVLPLKNNFSDTHQTTCAPCYRIYTQFNFGSGGVDNLKPELLFRTNTEIQYFDKTQTEFDFNIPDFSEGLSGDNIPNFNCFGALGGDCPSFTDSIKWYPENSSQPMYTWLSGDACEGVWVDRHIHTDGSTTDTSPSEMVLLSGTTYTYTRPSNEQIEELRASIAASDETIFSFNGVSGDQIIDQSPNKLNGKYV
jgi:hypothetical protein